MVRRFGCETTTSEFNHIRSKTLTTQQITISVNIDYGFESTGEFRSPKRGECWIAASGLTFTNLDHEPFGGPRIILRRNPEQQPTEATTPMKLPLDVEAEEKLDRANFRIREQMDLIEELKKQIAATPVPIPTSNSCKNFVECDSCRAKPGTPELCAGCQANRETIEKLVTKLAVKALDNTNPLQAFRGDGTTRRDSGKLYLARNAVVKTDWVTTHGSHANDFDSRCEYVELPPINDPEPDLVLKRVAGWDVEVRFVRNQWRWELRTPEIDECMTSAKLFATRQAAIESWNAFSAKLGGKP